MLSYFKLFFDSLALLEPLDDAERGRLFTALLQYANTGEAPVLTGGERYLFPVFRRQLDRDQAEYEQTAQRRRANGAKGGRPRACEEPCKENHVVFSETQKSQDKDKEKDKDKDKDFSLARGARGREEKFFSPLRNKMPRKIVYSTDEEVRPWRQDAQRRRFPASTGGMWARCTRSV